MLFVIYALCAVLAAVSAVLIHLLVQRRDPLRARTLHRLVVNPADEPSFSGVLREVGRGRAGHVVFADCRTIPNGEPIAGQVIKAKAQVLSFQEVTGAAG